MMLGKFVAARVESLPLTLRSRGAARRGRMAEAGRQVNGLFESLLAESFGG
jgi:hypothetical protein